MAAYKERINVAPWKISPDPDLCIHWCTCKVYRFNCSKNAMKYNYILYQTLLITLFIGAHYQGHRMFWHCPVELISCILLRMFLVYYGTFWHCLVVEFITEIKWSRKTKALIYLLHQEAAQVFKHKESHAKLAKVSEDKCVRYVSVLTLDLRKKRHTVSCAMILNFFLHFHFHRCASAL